MMWQFGMTIHKALADLLLYWISHMNGRTAAAAS